MSILSKLKGETKPVHPVPRFACPFYGFFGGMGSLMDQKGNQCALITESYSPCPVKMRGETPDWTKCAKAHGLEPDILDEGRAYPDEFKPEPFPADGWKGISIKTWREYVMSSACPRRTK